ncbi:MAG: DNA polymerase III subunit delta [Clostridium sp.]|nr:DNA polymerase III subunit delta [Clostridium sp.]
MFNFMELDDKIKKNNIDNFYILCGFNEDLMRENINKIIHKSISSDFLDLNYVRYDGNTVKYDDIYNACETLPFMSEKKVVEVYRTDFLKDKSTNANKYGNEIVSKIQASDFKVPDHCILIMYYVFNNNREKVSLKVKKLNKKCSVVEFTKLKGMVLQKKVKELFAKRGKEIDRALLSFFCSKVENNIDIIKSEVDKLCDYTGEKPIEKQDIIDLSTSKNDDDIFNLVDCLSQKKTEMALNILDELMFRGEKATVILSMIERQYGILLNLKIGMSKGENKDELSRSLRLHPYVCEKMMIQSKKYSIKQIIRAEELCLSTEKSLKSQGSDNKIKMELLLIRTAGI